MWKYIVALLIQINVICALTPNWVGTYILDKTCDPNKCCCFNGRIEITDKFPATYTLTAGVNGIAPYCGISHTLTFLRPTGFNTMITSDGDKIVFQLSKDSTQLTINYEQEDFAQCSGHAVKLLL